jgi:signal transduction histidine kinase
MGEFIEEVEVGAAMEANARGLTLAVGSVEPGLAVQADRQLLAAAVANLLQNAFKFTRPHGHVSLNTSRTGDCLLIDVADECGGLPPGDVAKFFGRFEQRNAVRSGLGLGLWITRKSVEAEGGEVRVRDIPSIGCIFTITLPLLPPAP